MQQSAKFLHWTVGTSNDGLRVVDHLKHYLQLLFPVRRHPYLLFSNFRSGSRKPRKVERQMLLQFRQSGWCGEYPIYFNRVVRMEVDAIEATIRGTNLILGTNCLLQKMLLYVYCIRGECMLITHLVL